MQPDLNDYHEQQRSNTEEFLKMMAVAIPNFHALFVILDKSKVDPLILFHVVNHVAQIANGTGYGQVLITIENGVIQFVRGEHSTKIQQPAILQEDSNG